MGIFLYLSMKASANPTDSDVDVCLP